MNKKAAFATLTVLLVLVGNGAASARETESRGGHGGTRVETVKVLETTKTADKAEEAEAPETEAPETEAPETEAPETAEGAEAPGVN